MPKRKREGYSQRQVWLRDEIDAQLIELCEAHPEPTFARRPVRHQVGTRPAHPGPMASRLIGAALSLDGFLQAKIDQLKNEFIEGGGKIEPSSEIYGCTDWVIPAGRMSKHLARLQGLVAAAWELESVRRRVTDP